MYVLSWVEVVTHDFAMWRKLHAMGLCYYSNEFLLKRLRLAIGRILTISKEYIIVGWSIIVSQVVPKEQMRQYYL